MPIFYQNNCYPACCNPCQPTSGDCDVTCLDFTELTPGQIVDISNAITVGSSGPSTDPGNVLVAGTDGLSYFSIAQLSAAALANGGSIVNDLFGNPIGTLLP
jgi:hypothetical protein